MSWLHVTVNQTLSIPRPPKNNVVPYRFTEYISVIFHIVYFFFTDCERRFPYSSLQYSIYRINTSCQLILVLYLLQLCFLQATVIQPHAEPPNNHDAYTDIYIIYSFNFTHMELFIKKTFRHALGNVNPSRGY